MEAGRQKRAEDYPTNHPKKSIKRAGTPAPQ
jgi:hypothetical protein